MDALEPLVFTAPGKPGSRRTGFGLALLAAWRQWSARSAHPLPIEGVADLAHLERRLRQLEHVGQPMLPWTGS